VPYDEPLTIQLMSNENIVFAGDTLTREGLKSALLREAQIIKAHPEKKVGDVTIVIRADRTAATGKVQELIQVCQEAEFDTFALRGKQSQVTTPDRE
jgi:biopolymer transport protein ExbD